MLWLLLLPLLLIAAPAWAACSGTSPNLTAASGSNTDIAACIAVASSGDTVNVPAGSFTWSDAIGGTGGRVIILQGAGAANTHITVDAAGLVDSNSQFYSFDGASRVTGIEFLFQDTSANALLKAVGQNFRVDHNIFRNTTGGTGTNRVVMFVQDFSGKTHPTGVMDHNTVIGMRIVIVYGEGGDLYSPNRWAEPTKIGNPNQTGVIYVEDNIIDKRVTAGQNPVIGNISDADHGAREVIRFNQMSNGLNEFHSAATNSSGARSWELYKNVYSSTAPNIITDPTFIRAGTGVAWGNTISGYNTGYIAMDNNRSISNIGGSTTACDGSHNGTYDGGVDPLGWPCMDQIGRGQSANNVIPTGFLPQASEPAYIWNNTRGGSPMGGHVVNNSSGIKPGGSGADIQPNRDFYTDAIGTAFDCTIASGKDAVGVGLKSAITSGGAYFTGCQAGAGFWVTNEGSWNNDPTNVADPTNPPIDHSGQGQLYVYTGSAWVLKYTPYTYPHPLVTGGGGGGGGGGTGGGGRLRMRY